MIDIGLPRWWPLAGILGLALLVTGALLPGPPPPPDAGPSDILAYFGGNPKAVEFGQYLIGLGGTLWFFFAAAFYWVLRKAEVQAVWSATYFGAAILWSAVGLFGIIPSVILAQPFLKTAPGSEVLTIFAMFNYSVAVSGFASALLALAASALIMRSGMIAPWIGWLGIVSAVLSWASASGLYVSTGIFAPGGVESLIAFLVFALWMVCLAGALLVKRSSAHMIYPEAEAQA